jgi:hypothetical protein
MDHRAARLSLPPRRVRRAAVVAAFALVTALVATLPALSGPRGESATNGRLANPQGEILRHAARPALPAAVGAPALTGVLGQIGGAVLGVAADGDRAYVGVGPRLVTLTLADPATPRALGQSDVLPGVVRDVALAGAGRAVVVVGRPAALYLFDVSAPVRPVELGKLALASPARHVAVQGTLALVTGGSDAASSDDFFGTSELRVLDIADAAAPREIGALELPGWAARIEVHGRYAYVLDGEESEDNNRFGYADIFLPGNNQLWIVDIADPGHPALVATVKPEGGANAFTVSDDRLYLVTATDELTPVGETPPEDRFHVYDVADPADPRLLGTVAARTGPCSDMATDGRRVVVACLGALVTYDVGDPVQPRRLAGWSPLRSSGLQRTLNWTGVRLLVAEDLGGLSVHGIDAGGVVAPVGAFQPPSYLWEVAAGEGFAAVGDLGDGAGGSATVHGIDVNGPGDLRATGAFTVPWEVRGLAVAGQRVYAGIETDGGVAIAEREAGGNLRLVGHIAHTATMKTLGTLGGRVVLSGYEFVGYAGYGMPHEVLAAVLDVWDTAVAGTPVRVGTMRLRLCGVEADAWGSDEYFLTVAGDRAYVAHGACGIVVVDLADPAHPVMLGELAMPPWLTFTSAPVVAGGFAYVADDLGLAVVDLSDPRAPTQVATVHWRRSDYMTYRGATVAVVGARAFVADPSGVRVVDVSDPRVPRDLGVLTTPGRPSALVARDGVLYVADREGGLLLLDARVEPGTAPTPAPTATARTPRPTPTPGRGEWRVILPYAVKGGEGAATGW